MNSLKIPKFRAKLHQPQNKAGAYRPQYVFQKSSYRSCPACHSKECKRNGKDQKGRSRYLCKRCKKSFVVDIDVLDIDAILQAVYDKKFADDRRDMMSSASKREIRHLLEHDREIIRYINSCIWEEPDDDKSYSDDEKDEHTLIEACKMAAKIRSDHASTFKDSWAFLLNNNNGDAEYYTAHFSYLLSYKHGIKLSTKQLEERQALLRCDTCGSQDLSKYGFNNTGRRRIKCNACKKVSIIRAAHIINESEVIFFCREYFAKLTRNKELIDLITAKMVLAFRQISKSHSFNRLISMQDIITPYTKRRMLEAFLVVQIARNLHNIGIYEQLDRHMNFKKKISASGQIEGVDESLLDMLLPRNMEDFIAVPFIHSEEELKLGDAFYQFAAQIHDRDFYNCIGHTKAAYTFLLKEHEIESS